jgi:hypothetical protein
MVEDWRSGGIQEGCNGGEDKLKRIAIASLVTEFANMSKGAEGISVDGHGRRVVPGYGNCKNEGKCLRRVH